jgi:hypothetical protein
MDTHLRSVDIGWQQLHGAFREPSILGRHKGQNSSRRFVPGDPIMATMREISKICQLNRRQTRLMKSRFKVERSGRSSRPI